jgi:oligoribonuclease
VTFDKTLPENKFMLFLDLETTGLDPKRDAVVEVAAILVEADTLNRVWQSGNILIHTPVPLWQYNLEPAVVEMMKKSGLLWNHNIERERPSMKGQPPAPRRLPSFEYAMAKIYGDIINVLKSMGEPPPFGEWITLAGFSVHFDMGFLKEQAPVFASHCHHRIMDISTLRRFLQQWTDVELWTGISAHRAYEDCELAWKALAAFKAHYAP